MKKTFIQKDTSSNQLQTNPFIPMKQFLTLLFILSGFALTAQTIAVQGVLRDPKGRTVDDGFYEVVFSIYDQQADGTALWSETHPSLATKNGLFVAKLGTYQTLDIAFDTTYYLGIAIEGRVEISPRMELSLAPYALGVFGAENYFPGVGDVRIKDSLSIAEGSLTLGEGSLKLGKGDMMLDSGNLTMQGGDIILNKAGAGIEFADGTKLTTAFGGTAANLSNNNSVIIAADTDLDGVGSIDLNIGDSTHMRIDNAGRVNVRKDVLLDSGQLMAKNGNDLGFGHWNPADSTYSEVMSMKANGTVVFSGNVKAAGTATADEDLVNLGTLNSYLAPNIPDTLTYEVPPAIGTQMEGGTVFANEGGYTYIAYQYSTSGYAWVTNTSGTSNSSSAFGEGQANTAYWVERSASYSQSSSTVVYIVQQTHNGYSDWFVPSKQELITLFDNLPNFVTNHDYFWTSSMDECSTTYQWRIIYSNGGSESCGAYNSGYDLILTRRIPTPQKSELQYDDNSTLTVGALQNYLPRLNLVDAPAIGSDLGGGKVFANDSNYTYVAYYHNNYFYMNSTNNYFASGAAVGDGYANTQAMFAANSGESNSGYWEYYFTRQESYPSWFNNQTGWYIPSSGELELIFQNVGSALGLSTGQNYWTSTQPSSCSNGSAAYYYYGSSTNYYYGSCQWLASGYFRTVFVRRIPRETAYTADDNDFVTVGFLLEKIAELEARIEDLMLGENEFEGSDGNIYQAYYLSNQLWMSECDGSWTSGTAFGSGESNTANLRSCDSYSSTNTSYTLGKIAAGINGYTDWWVPSTAELQEIMAKTDLEDNWSGYFWTSSRCSSGYATVINAAGNTQCYEIDSPYYLPAILIRRK